jgi:hypothetical protein
VIFRFICFRPVFNVAIIPGLSMSSNNESLDLNTYIVTKFDIYPMIVLAFLQNKSGSRNIAGKNTESDRKL